jgi:LacI family transcriptional regulator
MDERTIKLADVARACGVSVSTVSLVLRNKPGITAKTRQKVLSTARALGYRPKGFAILQSSGAVKNIGLILKSQPGFIAQSNPFYSPIISAIESICRHRQINLLLAALPVDHNNYPLHIPHVLNNAGVNGFLLLGAFVDDTLNQVLGESSLPVVLVDGYSAANQYDTVVTDNLNGAYEAITYLVQRGHHHIGLVGSHCRAYPSLLERRRGYLQALQDQHIENVYFADCINDNEEALEATRQLLIRQPQITAFFGINDEMALAAMRAAASLGRRIPQDISIVGFDDIDLAAQVIPPLTTMQVDKASMGRIAMQLLDHRLENPGAGAITAVIKPRLIERASVQTLPTQ